MRSVLFTILLAVYSAAACARPQSETVKMLDLFGDVFDKVKSDYVEDVSDKDLIEAAINGMLSSLDPHSSYLNEEDFNEMQVQTSGKFGGLGIEVTMDKGLVKVVAPIDDTPAAQAGLKSGDYISRIDDEPVMGITLREAVEKMRGEPGTQIKLEILREDEGEPIQVTLTRAIIKIETVKSDIIDDSIGYFRITSFSEQTAALLEAKINDVKKETGDKFRGAVLDLRNNPGGLLDQAIEVSDLFLEQGEVVSTGGRVPESNKRFNATKGDLLDGKPLVVVINGGSASASEIVAGALQDHKRAIVVGTRSFGKGSVQTVLPLSVSNGAMRLTTSRYYTPSGRSIQAEGIQPDIQVRQAKIENDKGPERMQSESSLRKHLESEDEVKKKEHSKEKESDKDKDAKSETAPEEESGHKPAEGGTGGPVIHFEKEPTHRPGEEDGKTSEKLQEQQKSKETGKDGKETKDIKDLKDLKKEKDGKKETRKGHRATEDIYGEDYQLGRAADILQAIHLYETRGK